MGANLTAQQVAFAAEEANLAGELAAAHEELEAKQAALAAEEKRLARQREDLARQREALAAELAEVAILRRQRVSTSVADSTASESPEPPDCAVTEAAEPEPTVPDSNLDQTAPAPLAAAGAEAPTSRPGDDDVFARLRALSLLRETDDAPANDNPPPRPDESERPLPPVPVERPAAPAPVSHAGARHHDEDESIDDYMTQLFARLNGARSGTAPASLAPTKPSAVPPQGIDPETDLQPVTTAISAATVEAVPPLLPLESLALPRRTAPECQVNLSAMRELANMSANSAIGASQRKQWTSSATVKFGAAGALGAAGAVLLLVAKSGWLAGSHATLFGFGAVLFVAGILWLLQGLGLMLMAWGVCKPVANAPSATNQPQGRPSAAADGARPRFNAAPDPEPTAQRTE